MLRCPWCEKDDLYIQYHDREWGVPVHDDLKHFEFLVLESAQAGLSWHTILKKRENYRDAYEGFKPEKVAQYTEIELEKLMGNAGIIRNRKKLEASINNAQRFLEIAKEFGSFDRYIWQFVDGKPIRNHWKILKDIPATSPESDAMSKALKQHGFKFVGSTICYAFMQSAGMVNDHLIHCFRYTQCG